MEPIVGTAILYLRTVPASMAKPCTPVWQETAKNKGV